MGAAGSLLFRPAPADRRGARSLAHALRHRRPGEPAARAPLDGALPDRPRPARRLTGEPPVVCALQTGRGAPVPHRRAGDRPPAHGARRAHPPGLRLGPGRRRSGGGAVPAAALEPRRRGSLGLRHGPAGRGRGARRGRRASPAPGRRRGVAGPGGGPRRGAGPPRPVLERDPLQARPARAAGRREGLLALERPVARGRLPGRPGGARHVHGRAGRGGPPRGAAVHHAGLQRRHVPARLHGHAGGPRQPAPLPLRARRGGARRGVRVRHRRRWRCRPLGGGRGGGAPRQGRGAQPADRRPPRGGVRRALAGAAGAPGGRDRPRGGTCGAAAGDRALRPAPDVGDRHLDRPRRGAYMLAENFLYTVEALGDMFG